VISFVAAFVVLVLSYTCGHIAEDDLNRYLWRPNPQELGR
jgi:hypothetical protein